jgi:thiamine biosynthesis protein ThiS
MRVTVNGKPDEVEAGTTVAALVSRYNLQPRHVAVEINRNLVPRRSFEQTTLQEGDQVEIVTLVGGGSGATRAG